MDTIKKLAIKTISYTNGKECYESDYFNMIFDYKIKPIDQWTLMYLYNNILEITGRGNEKIFSPSSDIEKYHDLDIISYYYYNKNGDLQQIFRNCLKDWVLKNYTFRYYTKTNLYWVVRHDNLKATFSELIELTEVDLVEKVIKMVNEMLKVEI